MVNKNFVSVRFSKQNDSMKTTMFVKEYEHLLDVIQRATKKVFGSKSTFWVDNDLSRNRENYIYYGKIVKSVKPDQHIVTDNNVKVEVLF